MKGFLNGKLKRSRPKHRLDPLRPLYFSADAPPAEFSGGRWGAGKRDKIEREHGRRVRAAAARTPQ
jgi:hypothetical protein